MNIIYILSIILITLVTNASLSFAMPYMKANWNAFITRIKPKKNTYTRIDCSVLESRITKLEQKIHKRQNNQREAIRQEIRAILTELKNK